MKEQQFRKLNEAAKKKDVNVTRNGQVIRLNVLDVLVGDLLQIETGLKCNDWINRYYKEISL